MSSGGPCRRQPNEFGDGRWVTVSDGGTHLPYGNSGAIPLLPSRPRQLLRDAGIEISEEDVLAKIGYLPGWGTTSEGTARALNELHPLLLFHNGAVEADSLGILFRRDPWIARLRTNYGSVHAVIVDRLEIDIVSVRDPWGSPGPGSPSGTAATIRLTDFVEHWHWAINGAVFPIGPKSGG